MKKISHIKNTQTRQVLKYKELVKQFAGRLRQAIGHVGISQLELAKQLGGFRNATISRMVKCAASSISIDLMIKLAEWADTSGISLRWLLMGIGPMEKSSTGQAPELVQSMNQLMLARLVMALADRAGVDLSDLVDQSAVSTYGPEVGVVSIPLTDALDRISEQFPPEAATHKGVSFTIKELEMMERYHSMPAVDQAYCCGCIIGMAAGGSVESALGGAEVARAMAEADERSAQQQRSREGGPAA